MKDRGEISAPSNSAREIDMPEGFWEAAKAAMPKAKKQVNLRVDPDIIDFFKADGEGHLTRMHAVLRAYVDSHKDQRRHKPS